jgi:hypothetical protein
LISSFILLTFITSLIVTPTGAQVLPVAPVGLSVAFQPPVLLGLKIHPENPLLFDFIVEQGTAKLSEDELKLETEKLVKYFLAALTIPDKEAWVNLSPYEKDRIIPDVLGQTVMGKTMLEQDYQLKQLASSLTNPDEKLGQEFWTKVKAQVKAQLGTTDVPMNTFNKVWIVPQNAQVLENNGIALVGAKNLKVMMDEDYVALSNQKGSEESFATAKDGASISSFIFRQTILPSIEKEINEGKNFAEVRQIYNSVILAAWYKKALKDSLLGRVYTDKGKVAGIESGDKDIKQKIYDQYIAAFKKGVYNLIKEESDATTGDMIPRKYFSGGWRAFPQDVAVSSSSVAEQNQVLSASSGVFVVTAVGTESGAPDVQAVQTKVSSSATVHYRSASWSRYNIAYAAVGQVLYDAIDRASMKFGNTVKPQDKEQINQLGALSFLVLAKNILDIYNQRQNVAPGKIEEFGGRIIADVMSDQQRWKTAWQNNSKEAKDYSLTDQLTFEGTLRGFITQLGLDGEKPMDDILKQQLIVKMQEAIPTLREMFTPIAASSGVVLNSDRISGKLANIRSQLKPGDPVAERLTEKFVIEALKQIWKDVRSRNVQSGYKVVAEVRFHTRNTNKELQKALTLIAEEVFLMRPENNYFVFRITAEGLRKGRNATYFEFISALQEFGYILPSIGGVVEALAESNSVKFDENISLNAAEVLIRQAGIVAKDDAQVPLSAVLTFARNVKEGVQKSSPYSLSTLVVALERVDIWIQNLKRDASLNEQYPDLLQELTSRRGKGGLRESLVNSIRIREANEDLLFGDARKLAIALEWAETTPASQAISPEAADFIVEQAILNPDMDVPIKVLETVSLSAAQDPDGYTGLKKNILEAVIVRLIPARWIKLQRERQLRATQAQAQAELQKAQEDQGIFAAQTQLRKKAATADVLTDSARANLEKLRASITSGEKALDYLNATEAVILLALIKARSGNKKIKYELGADVDPADPDRTDILDARWRILQKVFGMYDDNGYFVFKLSKAKDATFSEFIDKLSDPFLNAVKPGAKIPDIRTASSAITEEAFSRKIKDLKIDAVTGTQNIHGAEVNDRIAYVAQLYRNREGKEYTVLRIFREDNQLTDFMIFEGNVVQLPAQAMWDKYRTAPVASSAVDRPDTVKGILEQLTAAQITYEDLVEYFQPLVSDPKYSGDLQNVPEDDILILINKRIMEPVDVFEEFGFSKQNKITKLLDQSLLKRYADYPERFIGTLPWVLSAVLQELKLKLGLRGHYLIGGERLRVSLGDNPTGTMLTEIIIGNAKVNVLYTDGKLTMTEGALAFGGTQESYTAVENEIVYIGRDVSKSHVIKLALEKADKTVSRTHISAQLVRVNGQLYLDVVDGDQAKKEGSLNGTIVLNRNVPESSFQIINAEEKVKETSVELNQSGQRQEGTFKETLQINAGAGKYLVEVKDGKVILKATADSFIQLGRAELTSELGKIIKVGRNAKNDFMIDGDTTLSREHFTLLIEAQGDYYQFAVEHVSGSPGTKTAIQWVTASSGAVKNEAASASNVPANIFDKGGIDFDPTNMNLQIKRDGKGVPLPLPQQNFEQINIDGIVPVIINIVPITAQNLPIFLGQAPKEPGREPPGEGRPELAASTAS